MDPLLKKNLTLKISLFFELCLILVVSFSSFSAQVSLTSVDGRFTIQEEDYFRFFDYEGWMITENHNLQSAVDSGQYIWNGEFLTLSYDSIHYVFNPLTHSRYGVTAFQEGNFSVTLAASDFIIRNMTKEGFLLQNFGLGYFNTSVPWVSGMAHSYAIRCLLRAKEISGNVSYLEAAHKILQSYTYPWEEGAFVYSKETRTRVKGGYTYYFDDESTWYLEAGAMKEEELECILNGHIYALFGLWEYAHHPDTSNKTLAASLFDKGMTGLLNNIHKYELPFGCSKYSLRVLGKPRYMKKHIYQLELFYRLTNNSILKHYYEYWKPSYYIDSEMAPRVVSLNACTTPKGIRITWETNIPAKTAIEQRRNILNGVYYINSTLSRTGSIILEPVPYYKFRFYFTNEDNITRFHDSKFSNIIFGECDIFDTSQQTTSQQTTSQQTTSQQTTSHQICYQNSGRQHTSAATPFFSLLALTISICMLVLNKSWKTKR